MPEIRSIRDTGLRHIVAAWAPRGETWENRWAGLDRSLSEISPWLGHGQSLKGNLIAGGTAHTGPKGPAYLLPGPVNRAERGLPSTLSEISPWLGHGQSLKGNLIAGGTAHTGPKGPAYLLPGPVNRAERGLPSTPLFLSLVLR